MDKGAEARRQPVERSLLRSKIIAQLREEILSTILKPGTPLAMEEQAQTLGVSRTVIREALIALQEEGLVESTPYKGFRVSDFTSDDIREIYTLRSALEGLAISLMTRKKARGGLDDLERIVDRMREAARDSDRALMGKLDFDFHRRLCEMTGHARLSGAWNAVAGHFFRSMAFLNYSYPDINAIPDVHGRYLELVRSGDWKAARDDMERTIMEFGEELAGVYEQRMINDS